MAGYSGLASVIGISSVFSLITAAPLFPPAAVTVSMSFPLAVLTVLMSFPLAVVTAPLAAGGSSAFTVNPVFATLLISNVTARAFTSLVRAIFLNFISPFPFNSLIFYRYFSSLI